jgi:predicted RNase H-like HicB family nuclease
MLINMMENTIKEIIFLVEDDEEGGYIAKAVNQSIFTQADNLQELRELIKDAVHCHYPDEQNRPQLIRLHIVRDEVIAS